MVIVSCGGKFHSFSLTEQLNRHGLLCQFYTTYAYQKNSFFSRFTNRIDKEDIPVNKISTAVPIAIGSKIIPAPFFWNNQFDKFVSGSLKKKNFEVFIGWSGYSLQSIRRVQREGKKVILERGSTHILFQNGILKKEYQKSDISFSISSSIIEKELKEYKLADYICVPSIFVKNTFLNYGVSEKKLFVNPYGVSSTFAQKGEKNSGKFIILYLGTLSLQKGARYLLQALSKLSISEDNYEVWFIGSVNKEVNELVNVHKKGNWKFKGFVNHYDLPDLISQCSIAIQPSLQEGLSMVIPQMMSCGIPVIATINTGAEMLIKNNITGYLIPPFDSLSIVEKIEFVFHNPEKASAVRQNLLSTVQDLSWDRYGDRYSNFIKSIL